MTNPTWLFAHYEAGYTTNIIGEQITIAPMMQMTGEGRG